MPLAWVLARQLLKRGTTPNHVSLQTRKNSSRNANGPNGSVIAQARGSQRRWWIEVAAGIVRTALPFGSNRRFAMSAGKALALCLVVCGSLRQPHRPCGCDLVAERTR